MLKLCWQTSHIGIMSEVRRLQLMSVSLRYPGAICAIETSSNENFLLYDMLIAMKVQQTSALIAHGEMKTKFARYPRLIWTVLLCISISLSSRSNFSQI